MNISTVAPNRKSSRLDSRQNLTEKVDQFISVKLIPSEMSEQFTPPNFTTRKFHCLHHPAKTIE